MGSVADVDSACHTAAYEVDHDELPARVVGDVREAPVSADQGDVRRAEAPEHLRDPQATDVDERHGGATGADDDRRAIARLDVLGIRGHAQPF